MLRLIPALAPILCSLLAACGGGGEAPTGQAPKVPGVTDSEILIGSANDLSGPVALLGVAAINGARMRIEEANRSGGVNGRQIRLLVEDTQYQVPRAIQAANKLANRDQVFATLLNMGTPMNNAMMPIFFEQGIPSFFPISGARSMVEPFHKLQFTARGIYYDEIRAGAKYFVENKGATTPCVIYQDTDFGQEILDGARDQLAEMGMEPAAVSAHKPTETEFTPAILRLRNAGCDLVLMGTVHKDTILIFEAARKLGWDSVYWVGTNASYSESVAELKSGAAEGYSAFCHMAAIYRDDPDLTPEEADWYDRYVAEFNMEPEYAAMEGYRNTGLLVRALELAGRDLTRDGVIAAMESIHDYTDVFGYHISFGPNDHKGVKESILSTVVNGRWKTMAESVTY